MMASTVPKELILTQMLSMISASRRQNPTLQDVVSEQLEGIKFDIQRIQALSEQAIDLLKELKSDVARFESDLPLGAD